jgi:hypothetical protein
MLPENLKNIFPDWNADLCCDLAELMVSSDHDVVSAGVPTDLRVSKTCFMLWTLPNIAFVLGQKLATKIAEFDGSDNFTQMSIEDGDNWLKSQSSVSKQYQNFLDKFGHRCLREVSINYC